MDISGLKILVAEDNEINILLISRLLEKWDIKPDFATDGNKAVIAFEQNNYDVILMDIHMPFMDGYEATSIIRANNDAVKASIPIIALTASLAFDVQDEILNAGMNDVISKPIDAQELKVKLVALIVQQA